MDSKWRFLLHRFVKQNWFRSALYCGLAIATALLAAVVGPYIPERYVADVGANSVDSILTIVASSMLAVATFSLTTMVSAYAAASNSATPRAADLLVEDPTSHNALATFIGAFLFAIVGIISLSTGIYEGSGRVVLLGVTVLVIALVVAILLKWIAVLSRLGRVSETIDRVEQVTAQALRIYADAPCFGGGELTQVPAEAKKLFAERVGYVQHIDAAKLQAVAEASDLVVYLVSRAGTFTDPNRALIHVAGDVTENARAELIAAFTIGDSRTYEQDPRFGIIALGEIASRALSPGINDPGTAIDVIGTLVRLLTDYAHRARATDTPPTASRLHAMPIDIGDLFIDGFRPIARDGAAHVEVGIRLQQGLAALAQLDHAPFRAPALALADEAVERARLALTLPSDIDCVRRARSTPAR